MFLMWIFPSLAEFSVVGTIFFFFLQAEVYEAEDARETAL